MDRERDLRDDEDEIGRAEDQEIIGGGAGEFEDTDDAEELDERETTEDEV